MAKRLSVEQTLQVIKSRTDIESVIYDTPRKIKVLPTPRIQDDLHFEPSRYTLYGYYFRGYKSDCGGWVLYQNVNLEPQKWLILRKKGARTLMFPMDFEDRIVEGW